MRGGESHAYIISLQRGEFLRVLVGQQNINVIVTLRDPAGAKLVEVDLVGEYSPEPVSYDALTGGTYLLEVREPGTTRPAGRYSVTYFVKARSTVDDRMRESAERLLIDGEELFRAGGTANRRYALAKIRRSLTLWRRLNDNYWIAYTLNSVGVTYEGLGERQKALDAYQTSLSLRRSIGDRAGEVVTLQNLSFNYGNAGQKQQAIDFSKQAVAAYRAFGDRFGEAVKLNDFGLRYADFGEDQKALGVYNEALTIFKDMGERLAEADVLNNIGGAYRGLKDREKTLDYYEQALSLYQANGGRGNQVNTLINLGDVYSEAGDRNKALEYYDRALVHSRAINDQGWEAKVLWRIGELYSQLGEQQKALDYYNQGLTQLQRAKKFVGQTNLLSSIGSVYNDLGEWQRAVEYYKQALKLYRENGDRRGEADTLKKIIHIYYRRDKKKAIDYYLESARIQRAAGDIQSQAATLKDLGGLYNDLYQWRNSLYYSNKALKLYKSIGDRNGEAQVFVNIGVTLYGQNRLSEAREYYERAIPLFQETKSADGEATALYNIAMVHHAMGDGTKAIEYYARALPIYHQHGSKDGESDTLINMGLIYAGLGEQRKALEHYQQSLVLRRELGDAEVEAYLLTDIAHSYAELGNTQKELESYEEALPLQRAIGDRNGQAETLNAIANVYVSQNNPREALKRYEQSLKLFREAGDRADEAYTLNSMGDAYSSLDEYQEAMGYYRNALPLWRSLKERGRVADTLGYTCGMYFLLHDKQKAQACLHQVVGLRKATGDYEGEQQALSALVVTYGFLGDETNASKYLLQALAIKNRSGDSDATTKMLASTGMIFLLKGDTQGALSICEKVLTFSQTTGNRKLMALSSTNLGKLYSLMEDEQKALKSFNTALSLYRSMNDRDGEADILIGIGSIYLTRRAYANFKRDDTVSEAAALKQLQGDIREANGLFHKSLSLYTTLGNSQGEAKALLNICYAHHMLLDNQGALDYCTRALSLVDEASDPATYGAVTERLMKIWDDLSSPQMAIVYGKKSVNAVQSVRTQLNKLDRDTAKSFIQIATDPYRELADILIKQGRLLEAEQVLGMLKEEEYFQFVRRDDKVAKELLTRVELSSDERAALERYDKIANDIVRLGDEYVRLDEQKKSLRPEQTIAIVARQEVINKDLAAARATLSLFLEELKKEFGEEDARVAEVDEGLQAAVTGWKEPHTVVVSTIVGKDRLNIILTTEGVPKAYVIDKIGDEDFSEERLNVLIHEFRAAVKNPQIDPRPAGQKLYDILVKPLEKDLQTIKADTIVWSLDANLRYVPVAALYDARYGYLAERYSSVIITLASRANLALRPSDQSQWRALGLGVSKSVAGFPALENVAEELRAIVRDTEQKENTGLLEGHRLLDEQFTLAAFRLQLGHYNIIHAATHFNFIAGTRNESLQSFLLLGDGEKLTLAQVKDAGTMFSGVDLLVLSACETAAGGKGADGREIEGFGALAQKAGARAVIATLWRVADASTRELMVKFYQLHGAAPNVSKAEALRQAQLALLNGEPHVNSMRPRDTLAGNFAMPASGQTFQATPLKPYAHPYYWASFILIGNWR